MQIKAPGITLGLPSINDEANLLKRKSDITNYVVKLHPVFHIPLIFHYGENKKINCSKGASRHSLYSFFVQLKRNI